jgi:hypothetical protein
MELENRQDDSPVEINNSGRQVLNLEDYSANPLNNLPIQAYPDRRTARQKTNGILSIVAFGSFLMSGAAQEVSPALGTVFKVSVFLSTLGLLVTNVICEPTNEHN